MLDCATIRDAVGRYDGCIRTGEGVQITTDCLYPSFEQVVVFIVGNGAGYIVHDGGGAAQSAWAHGVDGRSVTHSLATSAQAFGCQHKESKLIAEAESQDWLWAAVAAVANAAADAARGAIGRVRVSREEDLIAKTKAILDRAPWRPTTSRDFKQAGESGKVHTFDLAVEAGRSIALIDAVVAHPGSIAAKYLAFSDTPARAGLFKYALYDGELAPEDKALLTNVADLIAFQAIVGTDGRFLIQ